MIFILQTNDSANNSLTDTVMTFMLHNEDISLSTE